MTQVEATPVPDRRQRRTLILWEAGAFIWIMLAASALHFAYELSNFHPVAAGFGSVNESTWEHLKLFFWPGLAFALVQHAFVKEFVNNYWWGKAFSLVATLMGIIFAFYFYLGIVLPLYGEGTLWGAIGTGAVGVLIGNVVSYRILTSPPYNKRFAVYGWVAMALSAAAFIAFTWTPPHVFIWEDFLGYELQGEYGILDDYSQHVVFTDLEP